MIFDQKCPKNGRFWFYDTKMVVFDDDKILINSTFMMIKFIDNVMIIKFITFIILSIIFEKLKSIKFIDKNAIF